MTILDPTHGRTAGQTRRADRPEAQGRSGPRAPQGRQDVSEVNVGAAERAVSVAAGAIVALQGLARRSPAGMLGAGVGGALLYRGLTGRCPAYSAMGVDTAHGKSAEEEISDRGIHIEQAFLINRSPEDLYNYWRNFENLPKIMTHLQRVTVLDDRRSHWIARAPRLAGGTVEWDAEITHDQPNSAIAWRSLPGSDIDTIGQIRFTPAMGDRGTEVHVFMDYVPPAGKLGHWVAKVMGQNPRRTIRDDLRNFKRIMEVGELPTTEGQPRGTCTA